MVELLPTRMPSRKLASLAEAVPRCPDSSRIPAIPPNGDLGFGWMAIDAHGSRQAIMIATQYVKLMPTDRS